jgi:hypothetical protein
MTEQERTDYEKLTIRKYAEEGLVSLAYRLSMRPSEIAKIAEQNNITVSGLSLCGIDDEMLLHLSHDKQVCPLCGYGVLIPWKKSGNSFGVCDPCRNRALASLQDEKRRNDDALKEYGLARKNLQRARRRALSAVE